MLAVLVHQGFKDFMKKANVFILFICFVFNTFTLLSQPQVQVKTSDWLYDFSGMYSQETFYGRHIRLLNNSIPYDQALYWRHKLDVKAHLLYLKDIYNDAVAEFQFVLRNNGLWGSNDGTIKTINAETKILDAVGQEHNHGIPRYIFWMREAWLDINVGKALGLNFDTSHHFKVGAFPFQLGRGISLGDAYAVGPNYLGFYSDGFVDQFACGALLEGDFIAKKLHYDFYLAILQNKCNNFAETAQKIRGQEYDHYDSPQRGFGKINFVFASRLKWKALDGTYGKLILEPYGLYNHDPEQKIEFVADASSKLATFGLAGEYVHNLFEFGFDCGFNIGRQKVLGWDRTQVGTTNINSKLAFINTHVTDGNGNNIPFVPKSEAQKLIINRNKTQQDESLNGKAIGEVASVGFLPKAGIEGPVSLVNAPNRYRNPHSNQYRGFMAVGDAACWLYEKDLKLAVAAGVSSGDQDPNLDRNNCVYSGFIPLQEAYNGTRVKSAHFLGTGKVGRPLSIPQGDQAGTFAKTISNFSNLIFWGTSLKWEPTASKNKFLVWPNLLMFWEYSKINKFDAITKKELPEKASAYLGLEGNLFLEYYLFRDMKLFCTSSIFIPGTHFTDIKGRPLNKEQAAELDSLDVTGAIDVRIPNIGNNVAYTFNLGVQFKF